MQSVLGESWLQEVRLCDEAQWMQSEHAPFSSPGDDTGGGSPQPDSLLHQVPPRSTATAQTCIHECDLYSSRMRQDRRVA